METKSNLFLESDWETWSQKLGVKIEIFAYLFLFYFLSFLSFFLLLFLFFPFISRFDSFNGNSTVSLVTVFCSKFLFSANYCSQCCVGGFCKFVFSFGGMQI